MKHAGKGGVGATGKRHGGSAKRPSVVAAQQAAREAKSSDYELGTSEDSSDHPPTRKHSSAKATTASPPPRKRVKLSDSQGSPMSQFMHAGKGRNDSVRWKAPKVKIPVQEKFCITLEDFNAAYGLSMTGSDPKLVKWEQLSDMEWFSVFRQSKDPSQYRIKCSCIRSDMYEQVMQLHYKVYQKGPTNMEINSAFAKGFVKEFSPVLIASGRAMKFNWAEFAVQYLQDLREKGYYEGHVNKWRMRNSQHQVPKHEDESAEMGEDNSGRVGTSNAKATKATPLSQHSTQQEAKSLSFFDLEDLQCMKATVLHLRTQLQDAKEDLKKAQQELEAARALKVSNAKVSPAVTAMRQKLRDAGNELQTLSQSGGLNAKRKMELEVKIETIKETLDVLGFPHYEDTPVDSDIDITCHLIEVDVKESKVQACESQLHLLLHMQSRLQESFFPTALCNLAIAGFKTDRGVRDEAREDQCTGCGMPLEVQEILAVVKLPCKHSYHLLCFAATCSLGTECRASTCQQMIPIEWLCKIAGQGHPITPKSGKIITNGRSQALIPTFRIFTLLPCGFTSITSMLVSIFGMLTSILGMLPSN